MDENMEDDSVYNLILFVGNCDGKWQKLVDIVLASWSRYSSKTERFGTKCPPPLYDRSVKIELETHDWKPFLMLLDNGQSILLIFRAIQVRFLFFYLFFFYHLFIYGRYNLCKKIPESNLITDILINEEAIKKTIKERICIHFGWQSRIWNRDHEEKLPGQKASSTTRGKRKNLWCFQHRRSDDKFARRLWW